MCGWGNDEEFDSDGTFQDFKETCGWGENDDDVLQPEESHTLTSVELEFSEKYCKYCGTQRCGGVTDKEWLEGCKKWQKFLGRE